MKKSIIMTALAVLAMIVSCGPESTDRHRLLDQDIVLNPQPGQDALIYYSSDEWPLACYFYDPKSKDFGQSYPIWNRAWVWAKTPTGHHVHAKGNRKGGYVIADAIYYSKTGPGAELMPEIKTTDDMEKLCQASIDREYPNKGFRLVSMAAARNTSAVTNYLMNNSFPIIVGEDKNPNKITRLVIFGDSLSDTGRLKKWIQVMPERPFFLGRFTNGGTWSDFLAEMANLSVLNYSTGGAVTKVDISSLAQEVIKYIKDGGRYFITGSLRNFIMDYKKTELGKGPIPMADRTLFVIWGGANDFLSKFDRKADINTLIDQPETPSLGANAISRQTVLNIAQEVRGLIENVGAQNILVANLPDIGLTPSMSSRDLFRGGTQSDKYLLSETLTKVFQDFNHRLKEAITALQGEYPKVKIILFDAAGALNNLMDGKGPQGEAFDWGVDLKESFSKLSSPGKPDIRIGKKCYTGDYLGSTKSSDICKNPAEMIFWDEVHPSAMGHCGIAYLMHLELYKQGLVSVQPDFNVYLKTCKAKKN